MVDGPNCDFAMILAFSACFDDQKKRESVQCVTLDVVWEWV